MNIGIDLGDTNFRISYLKNGKAHLIEDDSGRTVFPSLVSFLQGGGVLTGYAAETFGIPENTVIHPITLARSKNSDLRELNRKYNNRFFMENNEIRIDAHRVYPKVNDALVALFSHIKEVAEKHLDTEVTSAVIAVPDGIDAPTRVKIRTAAEMTGMRVQQLLNQTVSAALGYRFDRGENRKRIVVIDIGASNTSISTLEGGQDKLNVITTKSHPIGVNDLQRKLTDLINTKYLNETGINLMLTGGDFIREEMSYIVPFLIKELSTEDMVTASIGSANPDGSRAIVDIYQYEFEHYIRNELEQIRRVVYNNHGSKYINNLLLIGGGSNIPIIKNLITNIYQQSPYSSASILGEEAVALGAAIKGGILSGEIRSEVVEITVHDLGTFYKNDKMDVLIPRGTPLPVNVYKTYNMGSRRYTEKVYQWTGPGSGQGQHELDRDLIVLASRSLEITGRGVGNRFIIDESGIPKFIVTDLGNNKEFELTDFQVELSTK